MNETDCKGKSVCLWDNGLFVELAIKLSESFGKVYYYSPWQSSFPKSNSILVGSGLDGIERLNNVFDHIEDIDLFVFPDVYYGDVQRYLESKGKRVWGGRHGDELELYRDESKRYLEKNGILVSPYVSLEGTARLREYLSEHDNQWVKINLTRGDMETFHSKNIKQIEPRIQKLEHDLGAKKEIIMFIVEDSIDDAIETGYDGYCIDGEFPKAGFCGIEMKDKGYVMIAHTKEGKIPEVIKSVNDKLSETLRKYQYRNFISTELRITRNGDAYLIDPCFSDDTEVLTNNGWKIFENLEKQDLICTMDPKTQIIEYQKPTDYFKNKYTGEMILISNKEKGIECLVTPNHSVWRTDRNGDGLFCEKADSLTDKGYIPRTAKWKGQNKKYFRLPSYSHNWISGKGRSVHREKKCPAVKIEMETWLEFLGLYLSEGSVHSRWAVNISQTKHVADMERILKKLPFNVTYNRGNFVIHSVQLAEHVKNFGHCYVKRVPDYVKNLSSELIDVFLSAYRLGDGSVHNGQNLYYTTSKEMSDDIQELVFKTGRLSNIKKYSTKGTILNVNGKTYSRKHDIYIISERKTQNRFWFETGSRKGKYIKRIPYSGYVYDVTVPNHTVYVRRNGKPFWSSNCMRCGSPPSELYMNVIKNLADVIWWGSAGVCIEPVIEHKYGAELIIHSQWADKEWQTIQFPPEIRNNLRFRNLCKIQGEYYVVPQIVGLPEIGAVVAQGDSMEEAIEKVKEYAEQVESYDLKTFPECLDTAQEEIDKLKDWGIDIESEGD